MKKLFFLIFILFSGFPSFAQDTALYLQFPTIPLFSIIKAPDSSKFTKTDLLKKKATIVIVFSPDCDHCQHEVNEIKANYKLFKKAQLLMVTSSDFKYVKAFYDEYKIADFPLITMGRDPNYMFGTFFKVKSFPAIFLYNKKGNYVTSFDGSVPVKMIADAL
jgi:peroxiredoxin